MWSNGPAWFSGPMRGRLLLLAASAIAAGCGSDERSVDQVLRDVSTTTQDPSQSGPPIHPGGSGDPDAIRDAIKLVLTNYFHDEELADAVKSVHFEGDVLVVDTDVDDPDDAVKVCREGLFDTDLVEVRGRDGVPLARSRDTGAGVDPYFECLPV